MIYIIERVQGPAGFDKTVERFESTDGEYASALEAVRAYTQWPFDPQRSAEVRYEGIRPTFACAYLPFHHDEYSDCWLATGVCPEEGFE